jgi:hypothetical protein
VDGASRPREPLHPVPCWHGFTSTGTRRRPYAAAPTARGRAQYRRHFRPPSRGDGSRHVGYSPKSRYAAAVQRTGAPGHKQPPAMQKRLGQGQTYNPDRDRLLKRMSPSRSFRPEGRQAMSRARTWRSSIGRRRIKLIGCQRCPADSVRRCVFTGQPNSGMTNRARVGSLFASAPNRAR